MSTNEAVSRLPPELVDLVLGYLRRDSDCLRSCSLVCRDWLATCRHHLFSSISLRPYSISKFSTLKESPNWLSKIAPCVTRLYLSEGRGRYRYEMPWVNAHIESLASLQCVADLSLVEIRWGALSSNSQSAVLEGFSQVEKLDLQRIKFNKFSELAAIVASKPMLRILSLYSVSSSIVDMNRLPSPAPMHRLELKAGGMEILSWLLLNPTSYSALSSLTIQTYEDSFTQLAEFLAVLGPSLRDLDLGLGADFDGRELSLIWNESRLRAISRNIP